MEPRAVFDERSSIELIMDSFEELRTEPPRSVQIGTTTVSRGSRVRLHPAAGGDVVDIALAGRSATVEGIDMSIDGTLHIAVTIDDDPGRDLGNARFPGHRFFFTPEELEPLDGVAERTAPRILIAGLGNIFHGDDGFGIAVAQRMAALPLPPNIIVADFGIRSLDLAFTLQQDFDLVVLVDAMAAGGAPGTLYTIEPTNDAQVAAPDAHRMDPVGVLQLASWLGHLPDRVVVLGCEPENTEPREFPGDDLVALSPTVEAAVGEAIELLTGMISGLQSRIQTGTIS